jgi:predicted transcriptional regulator of viral defense system
MKKIKSSELIALLEKPVFTAAEARSLGISPSRLSYYVKINLIERVAHGVYRGVNAEVDADFQWEELIVTANSVPNGVVCLISALAIYEMTDEIPRKIWLAIPHATSVPKRENTKFIRMRDTETGSTKYMIGNEQIQIFSRERTIIDAFRYLSKEIAIKALKEGVTNEEQKLDLKLLSEYGQKFRLNITPYVLAITT